MTDINQFKWNKKKKSDHLCLENTTESHENYPKEE
jgi:hypothetical protein